MPHDATCINEMNHQRALDEREQRYFDARVDEFTNGKIDWLPSYFTDDLEAIAIEIINILHDDEDDGRARAKDAWRHHVESYATFKRNTDRLHEGPLGDQHDG